MWKDFFRAYYSSWGSGVTGTASAPLFVAAFLTSGVPRIASASFAFICFLSASYIVFSKERKRVIELTGRPEVSFTIMRLGGPVDGSFFFRFLNASESTATNVTLSAIRSGQALYEFHSLGSLVKSPAPTAMNYKGSLNGNPFPAEADPQDILRVFSICGKQLIYETQLEFSNFDGGLRWQVDYRLKCDYESKTISCVPGKVRLISR